MDVESGCGVVVVVWHRLFGQRLTRGSASSLGMMSDEEKKMQRIEDIRELLS